MRNRKLMRNRKQLTKAREDLAAMIEQNRELSELIISAGLAHTTALLKDWPESEVATQDRLDVARAHQLLRAAFRSSETTASLLSDAFKAVWDAEAL